MARKQRVRKGREAKERRQEGAKARATTVAAVPQIIPDFRLIEWAVAGIDQPNDCLVVQAPLCGRAVCECGGCVV